MESKESGSSQLHIKLTTKQEQYSVPDSPFAVQSNISISELNELVNELLNESTDRANKKKIEFDFLAAGEFIRTQLGEHLSVRNVSSEEVVDIEYVERLPAPQPKDCLLHDDWVSAVQVCGNWILSGCYDSTLHLWSTKGKHKLTIPGHTLSVKAVAWVSADTDVACFVSGSHDQTALLWEWNVADNIVECVHVCKGHSRSIECIGVNPNSSLFATGSFDTSLKIWSTSLDIVPGEESDGESEIKRPKREGHKKSQVRTPISTLQAHKEAVSGVSWTSDQELVTSSWDYTLRLWDVEVGTTLREIPGTKAFLDVHSSPLTGLLITASPDRHIRLYDPRSAEGAIVKANFSSHSLWVQTVRWSSTHEHLFISGAYDKHVKLWDTRSPQVPLYELSGHEDKVLCSDWSEPSLIVSGGADNTLRIFKTRKVPHQPLSS